VNVAPQGGRKHPEQAFIKVNTKNILFICGGAFIGLDRIILNRINTKQIGFQEKSKHNIDKSDNPLKYVIPEDLRKFGLIPELIGRLPVFSYLDPLDQDALKRILTEPKNAIIKQFKKLLELEGIKLNFEDKAIQYIAEQAIEFNTGARGLRALVEHLMLDIMYESPSDKKTKELNVDLKFVKAKFAEIKLGINKS